MHTGPEPVAAKMLNYADAIQAVLGYAFTLKTRETQFVSLNDARERVLAAPITADRDQPPFDRSTRDGFACRAEDTLRSVQVIGQVRAGEVWRGEFLAPGKAIEIMTGAPVPSGADCVVMIEHVRQTGDHLELLAGRTVHPGENIVSAGAEATIGAVIVQKGMRMTAPQIAAAASCGYAQVEVYTRPRIAILATGDELVEVNAVPLTHQIRNSNSHTLAALVSSAGAEPVVLPPARDNRKALDAAIRTALEFDLLLLSGGVSMGKYDLAEEVLAGLGAEFFFTGVEIQPGRPAVFGRVHGRYFFGLPGNPVSTMVTFLLFAAPMIRSLAGERSPSPKFVQATLAGELKVKPGLTRFLPGVVDFSIDGAQVRSIAWQGSGDLAATAQANCFVVVPPEKEKLAVGEVVSILIA